MNAIVVYESLWGNTAAIARAIADGIGDGAVALSTGQASAEKVAETTLLVAGSPLLGFALPTDGMRESIRKNPAHAAHPPDLTNPSMRSFLETLSGCAGSCAAFETRIWWSPGSSAKAILRELEARGLRPLAKPQKFIVTGQYGPLRDGELERAKRWGRDLAAAMDSV